MGEAEKERAWDSWFHPTQPRNWTKRDAFEAGFDAAIEKATRACERICEGYSARVIAAGMEASYWSGGEEASQLCEDKIRALADKPKGTTT